MRQRMGEKQFQKFHCEKQINRDGAWDGDGDAATVAVVEEATHSYRAPSTAKPSMKVLTIYWFRLRYHFNSLVRLLRIVQETNMQKLFCSICQGKDPREMCFTFCRSFCRDCEPLWTIATSNGNRLFCITRICPPFTLWKQGHDVLEKRWKRALQAWGMGCLEPILCIVLDYLFLF